MRLPCGLLLLALLPATAAAQVYRWVDADGRIHFTQTPPKTGSYDIIGPAAAPTAAPNQDALQRSLQDEQKSATERARQAEQAAQQATARQQRCAQALERLAYLEANGPRRLASTDPATGEPVRLTEEDYATRVAEAQKNIKDNCD